MLDCCVFVDGVLTDRVRRRFFWLNVEVLESGSIGRVDLLAFRARLLSSAAKDSASCLFSLLDCSSLSVLNRSKFIKGNKCGGIDCKRKVLLR